MILPPSRLSPLLIALIVCAAHAPERAPDPRPDSIYRALLDAAPDSAGVASVRNLTLERAGARFHLDTGTLTLLEVPAGETPGAVFVGRGTFHYRPPTRIERDHLARFYDTDSLALPFESVVLVTTDGTLARLREEVTFGPGSPGKDSDDRIEDALDYLLDDETDELDVAIMEALLHRGEMPIFHAHVKPESGDKFFLRVNPTEIEEVSFGRDGPGETYDILTRHHAPEEYAAGPDPEEEAEASLAIDHTRIEAWLDGDLEFAARARLHVREIAEGRTWLPFTLSPELEVDSARWNTREKAESWRLDEGDHLWIRAPAAPADSDRLEIWYGGEDLIEYEMGWTYRDSPTDWYPDHGTERRTFDLVFHTDDEYQLVSIGEPVSSDTTGETITTRWSVPEPVRYATFEVGKFERFDLDDERIPPVRVFYTDVAHKWMARKTDYEFQPTYELEQVVGADLANSLAFFDRWFGPPPMSTLRAAEIPYGHGLAAPGLVHLSWSTFYEESSRGYDKMFRAHEVAHQWWGHGVEPRTYHDRWLSEGIAEFSGLWYMHVVLGDTDKYFDRLDDFRDAILDRGNEAGPIWLGPRVHTSDTEQDYRIVIYQKGAWVLHMLRNMFLDLDTMSEARFRTMLRELYRTYRGKRLTTEQFRAHVEKHAGLDLRWFFDQWVYGSEIPSYRVSYVGDAVNEGYVVTLRVRQLGVSPGFTSFVPVFLHYEGGLSARFRVVVEGGYSEIRLPTLPREPLEVEFNPLESVLTSDVHDEGWAYD